MRFKYLAYLLLFSLFMFHCDVETEDRLFELLDNDNIGVNFINNLDYTEELNTYTFRNFYNGGGVALGDINNDGLLDIFFSGNLVPNKLYLNLGNWKFEDISENAGIESRGAWSMGVSMFDVNGDGLLDIYVCKSGPPGGPNRKNSFFINNGDLTFSDKAEAYGVANEGLSTHAAFFDFDKDGDLDFYLLNNSIRSVGGYDFRPNQREKRDTLGGNKFYRNDQTFFTDITEEVGIYSSAIGFGLGVTIGDVDNDGWQDMYVSNDYFEKDYLYINNHDGTFREELESSIREISLSSMGADMADLNNDGFPEIFVTDMLPITDKRIKTKTTFDNWDKYKVQVQNGYYRQFTRNSLQLNNGDGTFSEISRMAGMEATDWSWGALIFDMDNDGNKDIFVANGIFKDLTDQDYVNFIGDPQTIREILKRENKVIKRLIDSIPSEPVPNCVFQNRGNLQFEEMTEDWGLDKPSFSNGSAYGDLDNDGDLDLVVNNVNMPPFIYRNRSTEKHPERHFISITLKGNGLNSGAIGAKVKVYAKEKYFYQELMPMRSYQSTTEPRIHLGLGEINKIDSVQIYWPDLTLSTLVNIKVDSFIQIDFNEIYKRPLPKLQTENKLHPIFKNVSSTGFIDFRHAENEFVDFDRDRLIPHMLSNEGPCMCIGDIDGDGLEDIYLGGAKDQPSVMYRQEKNKKFSKRNITLLEKDKISEDVDCRFFDADSDGDLDLYVCSGGNEFPSSSSALLDRIYLNNGKGIFHKSEQLLPVAKFLSTSCVRPSDFDNDGDIDLFVGTRLIPFAYGAPSDSYLLENDGQGNFSPIIQKSIPGLKEIGMVKDAAWSDVDGDGDEDLVIVGEWMPIVILKNNNGVFDEISRNDGLANSSGLWNCIEPVDIDSDGDIDFIVGNHGLNSRLRASILKPMKMYVNDFDKNGSIEQIISCFNGEKSYPITLRQDLIMQIPYLKTKYLKYKDYSEQGIEDIFTKEQIESSIILDANYLESAIIINDGTGKFVINELPKKAQFSPVYAIEADDFNKDGIIDIILGGNLYRAKPEIGIYDASYGLYLQGTKEGKMEALSSDQSGIQIKGEIRKISSIKVGNSDYLLIAKNNNIIEILENSN